MHSINVYNAMMQHFFTEGESAESYAICGLLHDLCKANFYKVGTRNVKKRRYRPVGEGPVLSGG